MEVVHFVRQYVYRPAVLKRLSNALGVFGGIFVRRYTLLDSITGVDEGHQMVLPD